MSESTLNPSTFSQAASATGAQPERLPVGMAVLTIVAASGLLWVGIYAGIRYLMGS